MITLNNAICIYLTIIANNLSKIHLKKCLTPLLTKLKIV